jgi:hypothetical protein
MTRVDDKLRALITSRPLLALGAVAAVAAGAAFSCNPAIPSPDRTIWGCYSLADGHLIVIDHEAGETCPEGFNPLNWTGQIPAAPTTTVTGPTTTLLPPTTTLLPPTTTLLPSTTTTTATSTTTTTTEPPPPNP